MARVVQMSLFNCLQIICNQILRGLEPIILRKFSVVLCNIFCSTRDARAMPSQSLKQLIKRTERVDTYFRCDCQVTNAPDYKILDYVKKI